MPDIPIFAEGLDLAADVRDELAGALDYREGCAELLEIRQQAAHVARAEFTEARSKVDNADEAAQDAARYHEAAAAKVQTLMRANGLVFTADGITRVIPLVVEGIAQAAHAEADK